MPDIIATIAVKQSAGVRARQLWASLTSSDSAVRPIDLNASGKGNITITVGDAYYVFWQFYGLPGDTLSFEITAADGRKLVELKESKIPKRKAYQAGVREFTP